MKLVSSKRGVLTSEVVLYASRSVQLGLQTGSILINEVPLCFRSH